MINKIVEFMTRRIVIVGAVSGVLAGIGSAIIGGWTLALESLAIVMALDYLTGLIVAGVWKKSPKSQSGALESRAAIKGLLRKCLIVVVVIVFHQADRMFGKTFFRDGACAAFFIAEAISILENVGLVYPLPAFIAKALDWFHAKGNALTALIPDWKETAEAEEKPPDGDPNDEEDGEGDE